MKKKTILIGLVAILVIAAIVGVMLLITRGEGIVVNSGFTSGYSSHVKNDTWITSARSINGHCRVDKTFDADNLSAFRANATNSGGKVILKLIQGDVEKDIDMTGEFNGKIDMGEFAPGRVRMRLEFEHADAVSVVIHWK